MVRAAICGLKYAWLVADRWGKVSQSPVAPHAGANGGQATADDLFAEPEAHAADPAETLRQAYFWLVNHAVISPYYDVEFPGPAPLSFPVGDGGAELRLPSAQSYSSNVLLPLLTFAVGGKCLLTGGPGRGKTTAAVLMGVLAGDSPDQVRRNLRQGHPQLTVSDLVGLPLPKDLVNASSLQEISVAWRGWLTRPVKIVDEYNRIPTKTQSALLTMVAEGYVESHDQTLRTAPGAGVESWYFTANDDAGGGTFQVIQALRDRMDVTVVALGFNTRFFAELVARVEAGERPEEHVPAELVFGPEEQERLRAAIKAVPFPDEVRRHVEFFASHFEFAQNAGRRFEYRTKDSAATAGAQVGEVIAQNPGADLHVDLGAQALSGVSVRALQSLILYAKALAYFRGSQAVGDEDVAAVVPFVLRDKLRPNPDHPEFGAGPGHQLAHDPASWLGALFEQSLAEFRSLGLAQEDAVGELLAELGAGLTGVDAVTVSQRLTKVESEIARISDLKKLYGRHFDDLVALKYLHQRYTNYLAWLRGANS